MLTSRAIARVGARLARREYNFASTQYKQCFGGLPIADGVQLRKDTISYLDKFNDRAWYEDPVTTIVNGKKLTDGSITDSLDAFESKNGAIRMATSAEVDSIIGHMKSFKPERDYRKAVRAVEAEIFEKHSAELIGNQAMDFRKQDGVTEIEESVQANLVERRLNDQLLADEDASNIQINRAPAYVGCVSNFSNFLDLCRKVLRNIELGVPVVVLSRSNTTQHMYRWTQILLELMEKHDVDLGLVTYAAISIPETHKLFEACPDGAMYLTSSREVAASVRKSHPNVISSTGGPNTLVAPEITREISNAVQLSAMIENSGQCTALRHACIAGATEADMVQMFDDAPTVSTPQDALRNGAFAGIFDETHPGPFNLLDGYTTHPKHDNIAFRVNKDLPPDGISEQWRQTYVDMTAPSKEEFGSDSQISNLAGWLVRNQPITLAMNTVGGDMAYARKLFEQTAQVVYTIGSEGNPAFTCQARPQEGEVFGEFPVRRHLSTYTRYPVIIPSPTPAYNSHYQADFLRSKANVKCDAIEQITAHVNSAVVRGYCVLLTEYLADACGANRGDGRGTGGPERTILFGLQRPPLNGQHTVLRCDKNTTFDELAPTLIPFYVTNAVDSVQISCDPSNGTLMSQLEQISDVTKLAQTDGEFDAHTSVTDLYNVVPADALADNNNTNSLEQFPLVGQFVSLYFPVGHVKSTSQEDEAFVEYFSKSDKWLKMR